MVQKEEKEEKVTRRRGRGWSGVAFLFASHSKHCTSSRQEYSINATCKNVILTKRQYFIKTMCQGRNLHFVDTMA